MRFGYYSANSSTATTHSGIDNYSVNVNSAAPETRILPQFAFGGGWYSALYFANTSGTALAFTVNFVGDDGKPLEKPGSVAAPTWQALYTLHWDKQYAYWFRLNPEETHLVLDANTGQLLREQSLVRNVDYRQWDPRESRYIVHKNVNLREVRELSPRNQLAADEVIRVMPAWHCNIAINGYHYFLTTTAHRRQERTRRRATGFVG
jgi:hypothetical protein